MKKDEEKKSQEDEKKGVDGTGGDDAILPVVEEATRHVIGLGASLKRLLSMLKDRKAKDDSSLEDEPRSSD